MPEETTVPDVIWLNGKIVAPEAAVVSVNDRGFLFGDALYEAVRSYDGRLWALERHLRRLARSLQEADFPPVSMRDIEAAFHEANQASGYANALVYLQVTRGVAPRRHYYTRELTPTVMLSVSDLAPFLAATNFSGETAITRPDLRWRRCDIKATGLLANVMAKTQAVECGVHEAILVDEQGCITEGAFTTVFWVADDTLCTTPLSPAILPGITRQLVLEIAHDEGIPSREVRLPLSDVPRISELFIASTGHEVCPITVLDGSPVGNGQAGPVSLRLQAAFRARVRRGDDAPR